MPAIILHRINLLTDMGIDLFKAAAIIGVISLTSMPAFLLGGFLADRVKKEHLRFIIGGAYLVQAFGIAIFLLNPIILMAYVFLVFYYIGLGVSLPLNSVMRGRYFGRKAYGSIQGTSMMFITPFGVIAPIYAGWAYDATGSYITAFTLFAGLLAFSAVVMSFVRPPKPPTQVTDIRQLL